MRSFIPKALWLILLPASFQVAHARNFEHLELFTSGSKTEIHVISHDGETYSSVDINHPLSFRLNSRSSPPRSIGNRYYLPSRSKPMYRAEKVRIYGRGNQSVIAAEGHNISKKVNLQYFPPKGPSPVNLCKNAVSKKLAQEPDAERWRVLRDGLKLEIPGAYTAKLSAKAGYQYEKSGRVFGLIEYRRTADFSGTVSAPLDVELWCRPSPLAIEPENEPAPPTRITVAKPGLQIKVNNDLTKPVDCPLYLGVTAMLRFNTPGTYTYYFDGSQNKKTTAKSVTANGTGVKQYHWKHRVRTSSGTVNNNSMLALAGGSPVSTIDGWVRFNVAVQPTTGGRQMFRTSPIHFKVKCRN